MNSDTPLTDQLLDMNRTMVRPLKDDAISLCRQLEHELTEAKAKHQDYMDTTDAALTAWEKAYYALDAQLLALQSQCAKQREALEHYSGAPFGAKIANEALSTQPDLSLLERVVKFVEATQWGHLPPSLFDESQQLLKELKPKD